MEICKFIKFVSIKSDDYVESRITLYGKGISKLRFILILLWSNSMIIEIIQISKLKQVNSKYMNSLIFKSKTLNITTNCNYLEEPKEPCNNSYISNQTTC